jgi:hypothetical protein
MFVLRRKAVPYLTDDTLLGLKIDQAFLRRDLRDLRRSNEQQPRRSQPSGRQEQARRSSVLTYQTSPLSRARFLTLLITVASIMLGAFPALAKTRKSDPGPHPLKLINFIFNNPESGSVGGSSRGTCDVWLQNTSQYVVDKVSLEIELYDSNGRYLDKIKKKIGDISPGAKKIFTLPYSLLGREVNVKPRVWIFYNAGKPELTKFEAPTTGSP